MVRREFLIGSSIAVVAGSTNLEAGEPEALHGKLGIVTASLTPHFSVARAGGRITLLDFPQMMREELGLEIIDLNTMNFPDFKPGTLHQLRANIEKFGCLATNLKMNQKVAMASPDKEARDEAMRVYRASINAAEELGCRWVRPLPGPGTPDPKLQEAAFDELINYAGERGIKVLIENFGWMMKDPDSVVDLVAAIGKDRVEVGIDTGNWTNNAVRYPALQKTFPLAVTCDFKAKTLTGNFEHAEYDLKRCFAIGWDAGFRGPWCLEHGNRDFEVAKRELIWMREQLESWIKEAG